MIFTIHTLPANQVSGSGETIFQAVSVVAVIGSEGSVRSLEMAGLFSLFQVPQLSYLSSSALLDNRVRFSYFSRTVPSDTLQVGVRVAREEGKRGGGVV